MVEQEAITVLTLDAGGTNFVFSAIRDYSEIAGPIILPANAQQLDKCLDTIITGFEQLIEHVETFNAISFAFPGPADYRKGIIGDLPNFKAFKGGIPLGAILQERFNVPVFINNDGNLFASGVALAGYLPALNSRLAEAGSQKRFQNLIGITLGTGFGCGIVSNGSLLIGDNSSGAEIHNTLNPIQSKWNAEESVSTRAIQRVYASEAGVPFDSTKMPKIIYEIAKGNEEGDREAALISFSQYGKCLGASIVNVLTLIDGIVVIGGGLSASWDLFAPSMFEEINRPIENFKGETFRRLSFQVFNLEDPSTFNEFAKGEITDLTIPGSSEVVQYDKMARTGIALSSLGGSRATSLGAYAFAVQQRQKENI
ncbi:MAG: ROK family protein [Cyclobacteriaceae bacterium]